VIGNLECSKNVAEQIKAAAAGLFGRVSDISLLRKIANNPHGELVIEMNYGIKH
jgi:hypothetical protein